MGEVKLHASLENMKGSNYHWFWFQNHFALFFCLRRPTKGIKNVGQFGPGHYNNLEVHSTSHHLEISCGGIIFPVQTGCKK